MIMTMELNFPNEDSVHSLIEHVLDGTNFVFDNIDKAKSVEQKCVGLSYYIIQKTLITAIKRSILNMDKDILPQKIEIDSSVWEQLVEQEKQGCKCCLPAQYEH